MFGLGMSEMVLIGIVALIVIGPKDLPGMFRTMGQFTGKARGMAREFSRAMEAAADESGIKDLSNTIRTAADPKKFGTDALKNATGFSKAPTGDTMPDSRKATDPLAADKHETAARAKVPAKPAATTPKPDTTAAASAKPKTAAKPKTPAKPKPATAKVAPAKPKDTA